MKWHYLKQIPKYRKPDYNTNFDRKKEIKQTYFYNEINRQCVVVFKNTIL